MLTRAGPQSPVPKDSPGRFLRSPSAPATCWPLEPSRAGASVIMLVVRTVCSDKTAQQVCSGAPVDACRCPTASVSVCAVGVALAREHKWEMCVSSHSMLGREPRPARRAQRRPGPRAASGLLWGGVAQSKWLYFEHLRWVIQTMMIAPTTALWLFTHMRPGAS